MEINAQTKLSDILVEYPFMRSGMADINGKFRMLQTPMGKIMMRKVTIADISTRSGMSIDALVDAIARKTGATPSAAASEQVGGEASALHAEQPDNQRAAGKHAAGKASVPDAVPVGEVVSASGKGALPAWFSQADGFPVYDARQVKGFFLPELQARAESVPAGQGIEVVQSFEPVPLYGVMADLGFEYVARKVSDDEFRVSFYRAR